MLTQLVFEKLEQMRITWELYFDFKDRLLGVKSNTFNPYRDETRCVLHF